MRYAPDALRKAGADGVTARRDGVGLYDYPTQWASEGGPIPRGAAWIDAWKAGWLEEDARIRKAEGRA